MNETLVRNAGQMQREETGIDRKRVGKLAREEFSRKTVSYAVTALAVAFFGLFAVPAFAMAVVPLGEGARGAGLSVDLLFLAVISFLSVNAFSRDYFMIHRDPFSGWLAFLQSLPVSRREIVASRALVMLPVTVAMTALFLIPTYVFAGPFNLQFGTGHYLWFALVWLGYALFMGGLNLYLEMGVRGRLVLKLQFLSLAVILAVTWLAGGSVVLTTFELAGSYGPLISGIALLIGGLVFTFFAKATERRVAKREFVS